MGCRMIIMKTPTIIMVAIKSDDPRKLWMSDPYKVTATEAKSNFTFGQAN